MQSSKPHAALLASPGMGHLIPVFELGKRLVTHQGFDVTVFVVTTDACLSQSQLGKLLPNPDLLNIVILPPVDISRLIKPTTSILTQLAMMMREALPSLRTALFSGMKVDASVLIVDFFGTEALAIADEFKMRKYVFITSSAWFLALTVHVPTLDKKTLEDEHVNNQKPLLIPGCKPVRFEDSFEPILDQNNQMYDEYMRMGIEIPTADGILVNTWRDLEPTTLESLKEEAKLGQVARIPVYPIGPLTRPVEPGSRSEVLDWLDMQPTESVIYVSFGSGGAMSAQQTIELAWGLELSQQRFVWVVRPPVENDAAATIFKAGKRCDDSPKYLPDGFLTRTQKKGFVVPMWAPQAEILAHPSIGGFLSHCGWNSTLESIVNGVPMIAWPLFAEQKMNATMLTEELQVAIRSKELPSKETVTRSEIESMVRKIMVDKEGHSMRARVKKLKSSAESAFNKDGPSYKSLSTVAKDCQIGLQSLTSTGHGA